MKLVAQLSADKDVMAVCRQIVGPQRERDEVAAVAQGLVLVTGLLVDLEDQLSNALSLLDFHSQPVSKLYLSSQSLARGRGESGCFRLQQYAALFKQPQQLRFETSADSVIDAACTHVIMPSCCSRVPL